MRFGRDLGTCSVDSLMVSLRVRARVILCERCDMPAAAQTSANRQLQSRETLIQPTYPIGRFEAVPKRRCLHTERDCSRRNLIPQSLLTGPDHL